MGGMPSHGARPQGTARPGGPVSPPQHIALPKGPSPPATGHRCFTEHLLGPEELAFISPRPLGSCPPSGRSTTPLPSLPFSFGPANRKRSRRGQESQSARPPEPRAWTTQGPSQGRGDFLFMRITGPPGRALDRPGAVPLVQLLRRGPQGPTGPPARSDPGRPPSPSRGGGERTWEWPVWESNVCSLQEAPLAPAPSPLPGEA